MPGYTEEEAREAVALSESYSEVLRRLGMRPAGGNHALLKKYVDKVWKEFVAKYRRHRYRSRACGIRWDRATLRGKPNPDQRRVARPPYAQLLKEIETAVMWQSAVSTATERE
jgi:hypothetical protein